MIAQVVLLFGGLNGFFSDITLDWISTFERKLLYFLNDSDIFSILNVVGRESFADPKYCRWKLWYLTPIL